VWFIDHSWVTSFIGLSKLTRYGKDGVIVNQISGAGEPFCGCASRECWVSPQFSPSSFFEREAKFFRGQGEVQIAQ